MPPMPGWLVLMSDTVLLVRDDADGMPGAVDLLVVLPLQSEEETALQWSCTQV